MNGCTYRLVLLVAASALVGCASVFNDAQQTVIVRTDCPRVVLNRACWATIGTQRFSFETPARLTLPRSIEPMLVSCEGGLMAGAGADVSAGLSAVVFGNAIAGGAIGVIIDLQNQRAFSYPSVTNIVMPICRFL